VTGVFGSCNNRPAQQNVASRACPLFVGEAAGCPSSAPVVALCPRFTKHPSRQVSHKFSPEYTGRVPNENLSPDGSIFLTCPHVLLRRRDTLRRDGPSANGDVVLATSRHLHEDVDKGHTMFSILRRLRYVTVVLCSKPTAPALRKRLVRLSPLGTRALRPRIKD